MNGIKKGFKDSVKFPLFVSGLGGKGVKTNKRLVIVIIGENGH